MTPLPSIDLQLLATLVALTEERNVSRTAKRFGITQTAVSAQLARLREHFDDELFVAAGGRGVSPTAFALALAEPARALLQEAERISSMRQGFDPAHAERCFSITAGSRDITMVMARVARELNVVAPGLQMTLVQFIPSIDLRVFSVEELLERQNFDFAIVPSGFHSKAHPVSELYADRYVGLLARDHPIAGDRLTTAQFESLKHVSVQHDGRGIPSVAARHLAGAGRKYEVAVVVDSYTSMPHFLIGTPYISIVTELFAHEAVRQFPLRLVQLPVDLPQHVTVLQSARRLERDPAAQWLRERIRSAVERMRDATPAGA